MATPIGIGGISPRGIGVGNVPGVQLRLDWSPSPVILASQFTVLGASFRSFREPLKRSVKEVMIPSIQKNFASEGRPSWEPLSDFTIDTRTRAGFGAGPILKRKGMLARVAAQLNIWTITSQQAHVDWSNQARARYGPIHQNGARFTTRIRGINPAGLAALSKIKMFAGTKSVTKGSGTIPARPFLLIQDEDVPKIEHVFLNWVEERLNRTGFSLATNAAGALIKTAL